MRRLVYWGGSIGVVILLSALGLKRSFRLLLPQYGVAPGTPTAINDMANSLSMSAKAFKLGLASSLILPGMKDDPHGAFDDMNARSNARSRLCKPASVPAPIIAGWPLPPTLGIVPRVGRSNGSDTLP